MYYRKLTMVLHKGHLCIRDDTTDTNEPFLVSMYWPIGPCNQGLVDGFQYPVDKEMVEIGTFTYMAKDRRTDERKFELMNWGQTKAIDYIKTPIPAPKTKKELRWRNGEWQKLLKSGWIWEPTEFPTPHG